MSPSNQQSLVLEGGRTAADAAPPGGRRALVVCDQWLGSNGYAGMKALRRAGWSVHVAAEWEFVPVRWRTVGMRALGRLVRRAAVREFNVHLIAAAQDSHPDMLLVFKGSFVQSETIDRLRQMGVRCYCFFPDVSFRTHGPYLPHALPRYDWIFTTKSFGLYDLRDQLGMTRASMLYHAFDRDLHRPVRLTHEDVDRYQCDVSFIGTWSPKKEALLTTLVRARPDLRVRIWGDQWHRANHARALAKCIALRPVAGEEYVRAIAASAINLGILSEQRRGSSNGDQITSRTFHIPACGGFLLHERTDEVLRIFADGSSIACFGDDSELLERVDQYLAAPRRRGEIAERGRQTVESKHSWDARIQEILALHEAKR